MNLLPYWIDNTIKPWNWHYRVKSHILLSSMHHIFICDIYSEARLISFPPIVATVINICLPVIVVHSSKDLNVSINLTQKMCWMRGVMCCPQISITTTDNHSQFHFILQRKANFLKNIFISLDDYWHACLIAFSILLATILKQPRKSCPENLKGPENLYHPDLNYHTMNFFLLTAPLACLPLHLCYIQNRHKTLAAWFQISQRWQRASA